VIFLDSSSSLIYEATLTTSISNLHHSLNPLDPNEYQTLYAFAFFPK